MAAKRWPLKRKLTRNDWNHVKRVLVLRRVPTHIAIEESDLRRIAFADIRAAVEALEPHGEDGCTEFSKYESMVDGIVSSLASQGLLYRVTMRDDPSKPGHRILGATTTTSTECFFALLPATIKAVVDFLPITHVQEWMAYEAADAAAADE